METFTMHLLSLVLLSAVPGLAAAEEASDDLEVTMTVVEDEEAADEQGIVHEIELPDLAAEKAHSSAQQGMDAADQARQQGREFGEERSEQGRDRRDDRGAKGGGG